MAPAKDPKYARCRVDRHTPDPADIALDGCDVTSRCLVCDAALTASAPEWWGVYDDAQFCATCGEATPHCTCEGGPVRADGDALQSPHGGEEDR